MQERKIEQFFVQGCKGRGWLPIKLTSPSLSGLPDRMILLPGGQIFFAEMKASGKKPRPLQEAWHRKLRNLGFWVYVIDSEESAETVFRQWR